MNKMELDPNIHEKIEELSMQGNALLDGGDWKAAVDKWLAALSLVPEPKVDWEASTWLYASMGDAFFEGGDLIAAKEVLFNALNCPGGAENPFIHYRLGQTLINLNDNEKGIDQLLQAYMIDGEDIFLLDDDDGKKYLDILRAANLLDS